MRGADPGYDVALNGCWLYRGYVDDAGYPGQLTGPGGTVDRAHRVYFKRRHGSIPRGLELDHTCRVRHCVNPAHLEIVTNLENNRRRQDLKLTADKVRAIRASDATQRELAAAYGISQGMVAMVRNRQRWRL